MMRDQKFLEFCLRASKGNEEAANFLVWITEVAHFFDDLYDGDTNLTRADVLETLWTTMVALPRNEFYKKFFPELQPLIANAITNWRVANNLEASPSGETDLRVAFVVRSSYADLVQQTAMICGGPEWAAQIGVEARRECHSEPWKDYVKSVEVRHGILQRAETTGPQSGNDRVGAGQRTDSPATDRHGQRAIRVVETERSTGSGNADADLPATAEDS